MCVGYVIMNTLKRIAMAGLAGTILMSALSPMAMAASNSQKHKNTWRNVAIGAGAVGLLVVRHNPVLGVVGLAGSAYAASRYEKDRHHQAVRRERREGYYKDHRRY